MSDMERKALAGVLMAIQENDTNYQKRYPLVLEALNIATWLGYPSGIKFDADEGPEWPVVYIELPHVGQVSWHMPAYGNRWDGHTTAEKYERVNRFHDWAFEPIAEPRHQSLSSPVREHHTES